MGLEVLAVLVVLGIAAVVAAVHFTGGSRSDAFESRAAASRAFLADYPDAQVADIRLTQTGDAAFLRLANSNRLGFVQMFGHHHLTRNVGPDDLAAAAELDHASVTIRTRDFTWKGGRFALSNTADAADVARWCPKPATQVARLPVGEVRHG